MKDEYGYNGKKPRKSGAFGTFVVKYNKIGWILLIVLALYAGRGSVGELIHTFRDWEDIQEAKGDVILMQRLFHSDRFYVEDPENYAENVVLENGTYSHNLRVGSDITLEQEKFVFNNGDTYRHISVPYVETVDLMEVETLKMFTRFKYNTGSCYYYDAETGAWEEIKTLRGGTALPQNTLMYFIFDDSYYVLFDQLYAYEEEDAGVYEEKNELNLLSHTNKQSGGWDIIQPFYVREGMVNEAWTLESREPLVDLESGEVLAGADCTEKELILKELGLGSGYRWLSEGYYASVPEGYTPYDEDLCYRIDDAGQLDLLLAAKDSTAAQELAFIQLYKIAQNQNDYGYFEVPVQNTQLYSEYGLRYGYADLEANARIGMRLIAAARQFGKDAFEDPIRQLTAFFQARLAEGALPEYWHYKGMDKTVSASAQTQKAVEEFLKAAETIL